MHYVWDKYQTIDDYQIWSRLEGDTELYQVTKIGAYPTTGSGYYSLHGMLKTKSIPNKLWRI